MKYLQAHFKDEEYKKLKRVKKAQGLTWHDFILQLLLPKEEGDDGE